MDNITVSGYSVKLTNKPFSFTIAISLYFQAIWNNFCKVKFIVIYTQLVIFMCYLREFFADFDD